MTELVIDGAVVARAQVNIALIKYWGKAPSHRPEDANLPAVPSLSLTLAGLGTETRVRLAPDLDDDRIVLDGERLTGGALDRARPVLDRVRVLADVAASFDVVSTNSVPTAAGLASSASGMAALAAATARCAGIDASPAQLSALARVGSGSASRSIYGGWAAWEGEAARQVHAEDHWDVAIVVAVISRGRKPIGSREAMRRTASTSPFYGPWVEQARGTFEEGLAALDARDLDAMISAMEASTLRMHACGMAARPPVLYWKAASLSAIEAVERLRDEHGIRCGWTMDAGPNVKILCAGDDAQRVSEALAVAPGVGETIICRPGAGVSVHVEPAG